MMWFHLLQKIVESKQLQTAQSDGLTGIYKLIRIKIGRISTRSSKED